ncbi:MAG TPA: hypothetical protein VMS17_19360 [Gemmataceae bacterium]|nr:hypothetical protein [Gemmataceae bacterium]
MCFPHDDPLRDLAERYQCTGEPPHRLSETMAAGLIPAVRRVLRTGLGRPELVRWVRATLPQVDMRPDRTQPVDPDQAAPPLARLLAAKLIRGRTAPRRQAAETLVGA